MKKLALLFVFVQSLVFAQGEQRYADGTATDQDGNTFEWINYGTQDWAIENAEVVTYRDGTPIPQVTDGIAWENLTTGAWSYYNNNPTKPRLYNWYAVAGIHDNDPNTPNKEFAPEGWHVPSDAEWTTLENYLIANGYNYDGTTTGNKIAKAMASTTGWNNRWATGEIGTEQSLNNYSGFNAFPEGYHYSNGSFFEGTNAKFWSSSGSSADNAWGRNLSYGSSNLIRYSGSDKRTGFSVRFVRDAPNDTEPPVITLLGDNPIYVDQGDTYTDPGATATDNVDGDLTSSIVVSDTVDTNRPGTYLLTYSVTDSSGNTATATRTVIVLDTEPPVITLLGDNPISVDQGDTYTDPGATATDNLDGDLTSSIVVSGTVDTTSPGNYYIIYNVTDSAGNAANQATRTVVVVETTPTVNAGPDQLICEDQTVTLGEATASNYSSLYWTTNGDGAFNNPNIPNTSYTPGPQDRIIASFHLTLNAQGSNGQVYSDTVVIEIEQEHIIELTSSNSDQIVDEGTSISPITFSLGGGATAATISGLPVGISYTLSLGVITIDGVPVDDITTQTVYVYTITTTGNGCTQSTYSGTITVNPEEINPTETGILLNGTVSAENNQIKNVADPTDAQDAVTKTFIENFIKNSVSMEFFEWNISKVNADNQTIQLSSKPFVFVNAANTTIILPDESQVSEMDVIYIYSLRGTNNAPIEDCAITFTSNSHPISSYKLGDGLITASVGQKIYGRFPSSGLKTIVFIDGQWFIGNFSPYSILD